MEKINKIIYINLDRRPDRNTQMVQELQRMQIKNDKIERFPAIECNPGTVGCGLSHMSVIASAKRRKYSNVLILEDDFQFLVTPEELDKQLKYLFTTFNKQWDVVMLSFNLEKEYPCDDPVLGRIKSASMASGYLINRHYYKELINNISTGNYYLQTTKEHWAYANDAFWHNLQEKDDWFYFKNKIGIQRPSFSDAGFNVAQKNPFVSNLSLGPTGNKESSGTFVDYENKCITQDGLTYLFTRDGSK